jgi:hypothetical protein
MKKSHRTIFFPYVVTSLEFLSMCSLVYLLGLKELLKACGRLSTQIENKLDFSNFVEDIK